VVELKVDEARAALEGKILGVHDEVKGVAQSQDVMEGLIRGIENRIELTQEQVKQANRGIVILCNVVAESGASNEDLLEFTRKYAATSTDRKNPDKQTVSTTSLSSNESKANKPGATLTISPDFSINDILLREGLQHLITMTSASKLDTKKSPSSQEKIPTAVPVNRDFASVLAGISAIAPSTLSQGTTAARSN
jgi:hypothetical protein